MSNILKNQWTIYAHMPSELDWSISSYKKIMTIKTVEDIIGLFRNLSKPIISSCMLFIMKNDIKPMWEDERNRKGGSFSYKINNRIVANIWKELAYLLVGESLLIKNKDIVNGITISPKKNFCIVKVWLNTCKHIDPTIINAPKGLSSSGCIFKKHLTT